MKQAVRFIFLAMVFGGLSGCVSMRVPTTDSVYTIKNAASRQAQLAKIHAWQTSGALSVQFDQKADIANYSWNQLSNGNYQISISSALNLYQLQLNRQGGLVSMRKNNGELITAKTPEALLQKAVGWYLPISPLHYWYKGMPAPREFGSSKANYDQYGHLSSLSQAGWQVGFCAYKTIGQVDLPQEIKIQRPGLSIKIITRQWRLK